MQRILQRKRLITATRRALKECSVTVLPGARQTGKTTLASMVARGFPKSTIFDLERQTPREALRTPEITLASCRGLVVIDEIQRGPCRFIPPPPNTISTF